MKFEEQLSKKKECSEAFLDDKKMRLDAKRAESYGTIVNAKNCLEPFTYDHLSDQINQIVGSDDDSSDTSVAKVPKKWSKRPENWKDIVEKKASR